MPPTSLPQGVEAWHYRSLAIYELGTGTCVSPEREGDATGHGERLEGRLVELYRPVGPVAAHSAAFPPPTTAASTLNGLPRRLCIQMRTVLQMDSVGNGRAAGATRRARARHPGVLESSNAVKLGGLNHPMQSGRVVFR